ncbi:MAG: hypothetical protein M0P33_09285 [Massilibacteroides sp.]|nr:hypothetical protein [Massilibacteroides sp.]
MQACIPIDYRNAFKRIDKPLLVLLESEDEAFEVDAFIPIIKFYSKGDIHIIKGEKAIKMFIDSIYFNQPIGDVSIGDREIDAQTWSSTKYVCLTMNGDKTIFGVNFIDGRKGYPKYKKGTGCQRSDPKSGDKNDYPLYLGPQGDVLYVYNYVRCVRNIDTSTTKQ